MTDRMRYTVWCLLAGALSSGPVVAARAQAPPCRVEPFQGATSSQGAVTRMHVVNTGAACSISNYGVPAERANPAYAGSITSEPLHGTAVFAAPQVRYTPATGFAGEDEFAYEATARGAAGQSVTLKVRVRVRVTAPGIQRSGS